jgi:hypothetical protein
LLAFFRVRKSCGYHTRARKVYHMRGQWERFRAWSYGHKLSRFNSEKTFRQVYKRDLTLVWK